MLERICRSLLIRDRERSPAFYFLLVFLVIGWGLAIGRGSSDALFMKRLGVDYLPLMYMLLSPLLALSSIAYAITVDRLPPERTFVRVFAVLGLVLAACWMATALFNASWVYPVYFVVFKIAFEILVMHSTLYLSLNFDTQQAKRLTSPILAGFQLGTILGSLTLANLSHLVGVGNLMLGWLLSVVLAVLMVSAWHRKHGASAHYRPCTRHQRRFGDVTQDLRRGVQLTQQSPLLLAASLSLCFMIVAYYVLSYSVHAIYAGAFASEHALSAFYGWLVAVTSASALLLQLFLTSRVIGAFGIRAVNLYFPVSLVLVFGGLVYSLNLPFAILASFSKDTLLHAFRTPVRNLFFTALPGNVQGRARATSLIIFMPLALLLAGIVLGTTQHIGPAYAVAGIGLVASLLYLLFNLRMNRVYLAEVLTTLKGHLYLPTRGPTGSPQTGLSESARSSRLDSEVSGSGGPAFVESLIGCELRDRRQQVLSKLRDMPDTLEDHLVNRIAGFDLRALREHLAEMLTDQDVNLRATALSWLVHLKDARALRMLPEALEDDNARIRACAIRCVVDARQVLLYSAAERAWNDLLGSDVKSRQLAGIGLSDLDLDWLARRSRIEQRIQDVLHGLMADPDERTQQHIGRAMMHLAPLEEENFVPWLQTAWNGPDPHLRTSVVKLVARYRRSELKPVLDQAMNDGHPAVREAAAHARFGDNPDAAVAYLQTDDSLPPCRRDAILELLLKASTPTRVLSELAGRWVEQAARIVAIEAALRSELYRSPRGQLMLALLRERHFDLIVLALTAITETEGQEEVEVIRAALASADRRFIATAREVLLHFNDRELAARIDSVLETETRAQGLSVAAAWDSLVQLADTADEWFKLCVQQNTRVTV